MMDDTKMAPDVVPGETGEPERPAEAAPGAAVSPAVEKFK